MATLKPFRLQPTANLLVGDARKTQVRVRVRISKDYHQEPIISQLISQYDVNVNIMAALLDATGNQDGWFDLQLQGAVTNIQSALIYMNDLDLEMWCDSDSEGWYWYGTDDEGW